MIVCPAWATTCGCKSHIVPDSGELLANDKGVHSKYDNFVKLGINNHKAWEYANTRKSYWRISDTPFLHQALNNKILVKLGYTSLTSVYC